MLYHILIVPLVNQASFYRINLSDITDISMSKILSLFFFYIFSGQSFVSVKHSKNFKIFFFNQNEGLGESHCS